MNYNYYQSDKIERGNRRKALFFTFFIHFALLGGLYYLNVDNPTAILPDFVAEWFSGEPSVEGIAVTKVKKP